MATPAPVFLALLGSTVAKSKATVVQSYDARMAGTVCSHQLVTCTASASQASVDHTVRMNRSVHGPAKMEEPVSKTQPTRTTTAAAVPCTSLDDTVRTDTSHVAVQVALIRSVCSIQGIKCVTISVTTMNVSGMEATAHSTGSGLGITAPPVFPAGISLRMDVVIRSVTTLGASLIALSARRPNQPPARITSTAQTTSGTASVTRAATQRLVAGTAWTVQLTPQLNWWMARWSSWSGFSLKSCLET